MFTPGLIPTDNYRQGAVLQRLNQQVEGAVLIANNVNPCVHPQAQQYVRIPAEPCIRSTGSLAALTPKLTRALDVSTAAKPVLLMARHASELMQTTL